MPGSWFDPGGFTEYAPIALAAANQYGVDPSVFFSQIYQESGWNPGRVSPAGAVGITQSLPSTAANPGFGVSPYDPTDPYQALYGMAAYDAAMLGRYGGDYGAALTAYNAGPGRADKYGGNPANLPSWLGETKSYVTQILGGVGSAQMGEPQAVSGGTAYPTGANSGPTGSPQDGTGVGGAIHQWLTDPMGAARNAIAGAQATTACVLHGNCQPLQQAAGKAAGATANEALGGVSQLVQGTVGKIALILLALLMIGGAFMMIGKQPIQVAKGT